MPLKSRKRYLRKKKSKNRTEISKIMHFLLNQRFTDKYKYNTNNNNKKEIEAIEKLL